MLTQQEKINILKDLVAIQSVNDNEIEVCHYLKDLFAKYEIEATIQPITETRANLIAEIGSGKPVIAVSGHMDVVSEGDAALWSSPPFELTERNGKLYGRGAADMKSGLAALVIAMIGMKQQRLPERGVIRLLATAGEETEQRGSEKLAETGYMDDVSALLIAEPCEKQIIFGHKGSMNFKVVSKGTSAHSSAPIIGKNAITPLIHFISELETCFDTEVNKRTFTHFDYSDLAQTVINQVHLPYSAENLNDILAKPLLTNTVLHGGNQVNSIPESAYALFNARTVMEFNNEDMELFFKNTLNRFNEQHETNLEMEVMMSLQPVVASLDHPFILLAQSLGESVFDFSLPIAPTLGVTDASQLTNGKDIPFVMIGPGDGETAHQTDESVQIGSYLNFIEYYKQLLSSALTKVF